MAKSPLDAMKKQIAKGFKGKLKTGTIRRKIPGVGNDDLGDPNPGTVVTATFEGIRETFDASWAASAGIPVTDVGILVILGSTTMPPKQGDQIQIEAQWHSVRGVLDVDPAGASTRLQCFTIEDPTL